MAHCDCAISSGPLNIVLNDGCIRLSRPECNLENRYRAQHSLAHITHFAQCLQGILELLRLPWDVTRLSSPQMVQAGFSEGFCEGNASISPAASCYDWARSQDVGAPAAIPAHCLQHAESHSRQPLLNLSDRSCHGIPAASIKTRFTDDCREVRFAVAAPSCLFYVRSHSPVRGLLWTEFAAEVRRGPSCNRLHL